MRQMAGVLLTGGASSRMGTDKARLVVHGEALAARAARVLSAVCDPVIEVGQGVTGLPAIQEDPAGAGPLVALVAGVGALGDPRPVLLLACDLPFVEPALLRLLVEWPGTGTVIPVVDGRHQYACARYGAATLERAKVALRSGELSLRGIADSGVETLTEAECGEVADRRAFADVDTPEDLERLGLR
jgi:molybdopterin-guanine dinucleotide biosynthesis protein A